MSGKPQRPRVAAIAKAALALLVKLGITGVLLWMLFREHALTSVILPHLAGMARHGWWVAAGLASVALSIWLSAVRWQVLLIGQEHAVPGRDVLRITLVSHFFNITSLGAAGGDAYRLVALLRRPGSRHLPIVVSLILDHVTGLLGLVFLYFAAAAVYLEKWQSFGPEVRALIQAFTLFMAGSLVVVVVCVILFMPSLYNWGEKRFPRILGWRPLKKFGQACDALRRAWKWSLVAVILSVLIFAAHFLSFYCGVFAVGGSTGLMEIMAAMPIVDAAAGLPVSISGLGVREKTFETLMHGLASLPEGTAVSASLASWLMGVAWGLVGGVVFLWGRAKKSGASETTGVECDAAAGMSRGDS